MTQYATPRIGMLATVRNRRAIIASVEPFDGPAEGRLHLVQLDYLDSDGPPQEDLIWERELQAKLLEPVALPRVEAEPPMPAADFEALQRATRWTALAPFLTTGHSLTAPLFGAVQVEDFQLLPLLKALSMSRVSLLLADDVGLGKTIEAGLILTELLLRRRIQRVMILSPASLRHQWQQEMHDKFALNFEIIDRAETHALQKRLGLDVNPWRTYSRIITSYYYLRQPDILEQFRAACSQPTSRPNLPWDLLIVDEAHNLMPANFGDDSDLAKMLRFISPWFEHKIFLTATPHNGHTRCFTGLLEQLDPVRFTQTSEFTSAIEQRVSEVVIRRLKREINQHDLAANRPARFPERHLHPLHLYLGQTERALSAAFQQFRRAVYQLPLEKSAHLAGTFALTVLNKRLLSSPYTFAESWHRFKAGMAQAEEADTPELQAAQRAIEEELDDDQETEGRINHAAQTTGAWLKPRRHQLTEEVAALDHALTNLGLMPPEGEALPNPHTDARWQRLLQLLKERFRQGKTWLPGARLIIFTEYKTTLDYLIRRLRHEFKDDGLTIRELYGGLADDIRQTIKQAFNDPADPLRVLVATDTASEGLNLQETAHQVLHYDIPFNPARLDQRNGRLDRHGQAHDVTVYHFTSEDDADLKFLDYVVQKVHTIREELGSMGELFDAAFERRFIEGHDTADITRQVDEAVKQRQGKTILPRFNQLHTGQEQAQLTWLTNELDLTPETLRQTLEQALGYGFGLPRLEETEQPGRLRLCLPLPPRWERLIDDHLRLNRRDGQPGALPQLTFDPQHFIQLQNGRPIYRASKDTTLLHLGHPIFQYALTLYARARFPGGESQPPSRWTVRYGAVPAGAEALVLLTVEALAVNELREPFHHWVQTHHFPIVDGDLGDPLPHRPAAHDRPSPRPVDRAAIEQAQELWEEVALAVKRQVRQLAQTLTQALMAGLKQANQTADKQERDRFEHRRQEIERAKQETTLQKLQAELEKHQAEQQQLSLRPALFPELQAEQATRARELTHRQTEIETELTRRRQHYNDLLTQLTAERQRVLEKLLPQRYALRGEAQLFPVTIEIRLPD